MSSSSLREDVLRALETSGLVAYRNAVDSSRWEEVLSKFYAALRAKGIFRIDPRSNYDRENAFGWVTPKTESQRRVCEMEFIHGYIYWREVKE